MNSGQRLRASVLSIRSDHKLTDQTLKGLRIAVIRSPRRIASGVVKYRARLSNTGRDGARRGLGIVEITFQAVIVGDRPATPKNAAAGSQSPNRESRTGSKVLVREGQTVRVRLQDGAISVELKGIARQAGRRGEWIEVKNARGGRVFRAKVSSDGAVTVAVKESAI